MHSYCVYVHVLVGLYVNLYTLACTSLSCVYLYHCVCTCVHICAWVCVLMQARVYTYVCLLAEYVCLYMCMHA